MTRTEQGNHQAARPAGATTAPGGRAPRGVALLCAVAVLAVAGVAAGCGEDEGAGGQQAQPQQGDQQRQTDQQQPQGQEPPRGDDVERLAQRAADLERDVERTGRGIFENPSMRGDAADRLSQLQRRAAELQADARAQLEGEPRAQEVITQAAERAGAATTALNEFVESGSADAAAEARRALNDADRQLARLPDAVEGQDRDRLPQDLRRRLEETGVDLPELSR